jgi:hypothetical protein
MKDFPLTHEFELERKAPNEVSQASLAALAVMAEAVRNSDFGLIPMLPKFNNPAYRVVEPAPEQESYDNLVDFEAYRQANVAGQPAGEVATQPVQETILDEPTNLTEIRQNIDRLYGEERRAA